MKALIYWDTQDPEDIGWAYRTANTSGGFDMSYLTEWATDKQLWNYYLDEVDDDVEEIVVNREGCPVSAAEADAKRAKAMRFVDDDY